MTDDFDLLVKSIKSKLIKQRRKTIKIDELEILLKDLKTDLVANNIENIKPKKKKTQCKRPLSLYNKFIKNYIEQNSKSNISQQAVLIEGAKIWSTCDRKNLLEEYKISLI